MGSSLHGTWVRRRALARNCGTAPASAPFDNMSPLAAGMSAVSAALVREGLRSKLLGSRMLVATNAVNLAVQLYQIGCAQAGTLG